jgi:GNAT superfamily N-acetyltransferase
MKGRIHDGTSRGLGSDLIFRRGRAEDSRPAFDLSIAAMRDLFARQNHPLQLDANSFWALLQPYLTHLGAHASEWWVAEDPRDGSLVGHARSVERDGLFELSELFVRPGSQSAGVGKSLIKRAFPIGRGETRLILATNDVRALARYYAADTVARFPVASLAAKPKPSAGGEGRAEVIAATSDDTNLIAELEEAVVGYARSADYPWLFEHREGFLYHRRGRAVGFGFFSATGVGPIAALEPADQRSILLHLEQRAHDTGVEEINFQVPTINAVAMHHLLGRGFKIDAPLNLFMSNRSFGHFDRFIAFGPPIVL